MTAHHKRHAQPAASPTTPPPPPSLAVKRAHPPGEPRKRLTPEEVQAAVERAIARSAAKG